MNFKAFILHQKIFHPFPALQFWYFWLIFLYLHLSELLCAQKRFGSLLQSLWLEFGKGKWSDKKETLERKISAQMKDVDMDAVWRINFGSRVSKRRIKLKLKDESKLILCIHDSSQFGKLAFGFSWDHDLRQLNSICGFLGSLFPQ